MKLKVIAITIWLLFTISLSLWWLYFGLGQLELLQSVEGTEKVITQQRMLIWEGISLVVSIILGGVALGYLAYSERKERKRIEEFFSVFSHELKTPLTNIQLQAESLGANKLIESTQRLLIHLDNAMFVAKLPDELFHEEVDLKLFIKSLASRWSSFEIEIIGEAVMEIDKRIFEAVCQNLFSNAVIHGGASKIVVNLQDSNNTVRIIFTDNGIGFNGDYNRLGTKFYRLNKTSGSGLGLYIVKELLNKLHGKLRFKESSQGFIVDIALPKSI